MSQFDPVIGADKSGLAYRQDDNNGKKALLNHHKAPTAPSYAEAGMVWLDDSATPWLMKTYDGVDWITIGSVHAGDNEFTPYYAGAALDPIEFSTMTLISTATASADAYIDFASLDTATYGSFYFEFENITAETDSVTFRMRISTDGGSTFKAGASDYDYVLTGIRSSDGASINANSSATGQIPLLGGNTQGNIATESLNGYIFVNALADTASYCSIMGLISYGNTGGNLCSAKLSGRYIGATTAVDAIRFLYSSGNITSGTIRLYGVKK